MGDMEMFDAQYCLPLHECCNDKFLDCLKNEIIYFYGIPKVIQ